MKNNGGKYIMISVLLPTRKRVNLLKGCLESLKGSDFDKYEIIFRIDNDDNETLEFVESIKDVQKKVIVGDRKRGYADLHNYYNECCEIAEGTFLWLFNDDIIIKENNIDWASIMLEHQNDEVVLDIISYYTTMPGDPWPGMFPAMHKNLYKVLGHFSLNPHNDSYLQEVFQKSNLGLWKILKTPTITTFRNEIGSHASEWKDITGIEADAAMVETSASFGSVENVVNIKKDIEKLKNYQLQKV